MGPILLIFMFFWRVETQEVSTPSSQLRPRNFNHHPFDAARFLKDLSPAEPTKQGPVLFPNDAPPPPRPALVTSRPLLESIARSELANNSVTSQSQDNVAFVPFLARVKDYRPYIPTPKFDYHFLPTQVPYAEVVKKSRYNQGRDNRYDDYEERTVLPPIYKALSEYAKQKVLKVQDNNIYQNHLPEFRDRPRGNHIEDDQSEHDQNQNYAFSYRVKDRATGDDFSHSQHSSGSATNGEYRVRLPDGRMQIVSYTADENGYKADVRYDDEQNGNTIEERRHFNNGYTASYGNLVTPTYYNDHDNKYIVPTARTFINKYSNYIVPTQSYYNDYYANKNDYVDRNAKTDYDSTEKKNEKEKDYHYDTSKEYYNDYSSEYNSHVEPHKSKFNFVDDKNEVFKASTVTPSYDELKDLFVTKSLYNTEHKYDDVKSTVTNEVTTERVVLIGNRNPNLYTNIKHSLPLTVAPVTYATPKVVVATTPRSYLVSTIASLKNKVHLATKPVLSESFINRINKYIHLK